jgi:hypothetical protein
MSEYVIPETIEVESVPDDVVVLVASGDLRLSANQMCWEAQSEM